MSKLYDNWENPIEFAVNSYVTQQGFVLRKKVVIIDGDMRENVESIEPTEMYDKYFNSNAGKKEMIQSAKKALKEKN